MAPPRPSNAASSRLRPPQAAGKPRSNAACSCSSGVDRWRTVDCFSPKFLSQIARVLRLKLELHPFSIGDFVGRAASATRHLAQCAHRNQFIDVPQSGVG